MNKNCRFITLLSMLVALLVNTMPLHSESLQNAIDFFKNTPFCSTASVTDVSTEDNDLTVSLDIDPRWSKTLGKKPEEFRALWFAIHCPIEFSRIWNDIPEESDVFIQSKLPGYGNYQFNCRNLLTQ